VSVDRLRRLCLTIGLAMASIAAGWGILLTLLPDELGRSLLAANWEPADRLVLLLSLGLATSSFSSGALIGLRAFAAATRSLRATVISSSLTTVTTVVGASLFGAIGAAWGILLAHSAAMALWWWEFHRESRRYVAPSPEAGPVPDASAEPGFGGSS
jgi:O-antigen/teichoic acid export membrane protein